MSKEVVDGLYDQIVTKPERIFGPDYYGEFLNWGYWKADTETQVEACENLVEMVASMIPKRDGALLEVGCGLGGVIRYLTRHWPASSMTGINVMEDQLGVCRKRVPEATFERMDAVKLAFANESFENVISVEAAFHFGTRRKFLEEAFRVLKPGGYLGVADIIGNPYIHRANLVNDPAVYRELLRQVGFCEIKVIDVTDETTHAHADYGIRYLERKLEAGEIERAEYEHAVLSRVVRLGAGRYYVVAGARKPIPGKPSWKSGPGGIDAQVEKMLVDTAGA
jgi:MPBQ/MSBQ methyltransferase